MSPKSILVLAAAALLLTACARDLSSTTYSQSNTSGKALKGTVISARPVTIKNHDKLGDNTTGGLLGGGAGAAAGSQFGSGSGNVGATIGGAVAGAIAGAVIEDALTTEEGMEYLVEIDNKHARSKKSKTKKEIRHTTKDGSIETDMKLSIDTDMETDIVSVVQAADPAITEGSRVYVVYHDDRPRLVPRK